MLETPTAAATHDEFCYFEHDTCDRCWGSGFVITCLDYLCANSDECIHGDGEEPCPKCHGRGEISVCVSEHCPMKAGQP